MKFMKVVCCLLNNFWCDSSDRFIRAEPLDVRLRNETFCWDPRYFSVVERSVVSCAILEPDRPQDMMGFEFLTMLNHVHDDFGVLFVGCSVYGCSCLIKMNNHHFWMPTKALHTSSSIRCYTLYTLLGKKIRWTSTSETPNAVLMHFFVCFWYPPSGSCDICGRHGNFLPTSPAI